MDQPKETQAATEIIDDAALDDVAGGVAKVGLGIKAKPGATQFGDQPGLQGGDMVGNG